MADPIDLALGNKKPPARTTTAAAAESSIGPLDIGMAPMTPEQILEGVTKEIESQIAAAVAPLETQVGTLGTERERAAGEIGTLFDTVTGEATASAGRQRASAAEALAAEKAIFGEARDNLAQLSAKRAADAQALAQQIGGYVPLSEFQDPASFESSLFESNAAGSLLKASGVGEANVQYAEAFSGRVLPLMRAREIATTRAQFDREITRIQAEVAAIKAQKGGLINEKVRERVLQEREFALQRATANRDWQIAKQTSKLQADQFKQQVKGANRDWQMAQKSMKLEQERIRLQAIELYGQDVTYNPKTGTYTPKKGGPKTAAVIQAGKELNQRSKELKAQQDVARKAAIADRQAAAYELVDAFMTPGTETIKGGKTWMPAAGPDSPGAFWNGNQWMVAVNAPDQQITRPAVTNPNELVQALVGKGIPRDLARRVVGKRFPGWVEGQAAGSPTEVTPRAKPPGSQARQFTNAELNKMPPVKLLKTLRGLGFKEKIPPSILRLRQKEPNVRGVEVPAANNKEYNTRLAAWARYWILKIYDADRSAGAVGAKPRGG